MLISPAYAQAAGGGTAGGFEAFLPLILIFVVFYFLLIRPQQKKMKQHRDMLAAVRRGDRVVTGGGIIGLVTKVVGESEVVVEIADNVRVKVLRSSISEILSKTEPVSGAPRGKDEDEDVAEKPEAPAAAEEKGSRLGRLLGGKDK